jgi:hypothetical protein
VIIQRRLRKTIRISQFVIHSAPQAEDLHQAEQFVGGGYRIEIVQMVIIGVGYFLS